jgi:hypothetical protein
LILFEKLEKLVLVVLIEKELPCPVKPESLVERELVFEKILLKIFFSLIILLFGF